MKSKAPMIIFILLGALSTYLFFKLMEPYSEMQDAGWSSKAHRNPYLAAELFLQKTGIDVVATHDIHQIDQLPEHGTIFISDVRKVLTRKRLEKILEWIQLGGHLIISAPIHDKYNPDPLLAYFKVENHRTESRKLSEIIKETNLKLKTGKVDLSKKEDSEPVDVTLLGFRDVDARVRIAFSPDSYLSHPKLLDDKYQTEPLYEISYAAGSESGVHFLQLNYGEGMLSVLSDQTIWESSRIDKLDHAYLLWLLSEHSESVVMLYGAQMESIFYYLEKYALEMMIGTLVFMVAWSIYRARRFGKVAPTSAEQRRALAEHIQACSQYYWRQGDIKALIEPARYALIRHIAISLPGSGDVDRSAKVKIIAEHTGLSTDQINFALYAVFSENENEYIKIMTQLQLLRNAL